MGRKNLFNQSLIYNQHSYIYYKQKLTELAISMFDWKNLPSTCDARYLELALFGDGKAIFFKDEVIGHIALNCLISGKLDIYGEPILRRAWSRYNNYQVLLKGSNSVIIWNNYLRTNTYPDIVMFAKKLYNLDRAIDVNANAQKTPVLIQASEKQRLTMLNLYQKYEGNEPFIFGTSDLDVNNLSVLKTDAPYVADKLYQLKTQIWNEALTHLGIANLNIQKKERLVADEVVRNQGGTIASRYSRLMARREACKLINNMFDLDIECDFREDYREADDEVMFAGESGDNSLKSMAYDIRTA